MLSSVVLELTVGEKMLIGIILMQHKGDVLWNCAPVIFTNQHHCSKFNNKKYILFNYNNIRYY